MIDICGLLYYFVTSLDFCHAYHLFTQDLENIVMNQSLAGIYYLMAVLPVWALGALVAFVALVPLFIIRDRKEGVYYQVSYSAFIDDLALCFAVMVVASIVHRGAYSPPALWQHWISHVGALVACVAAGALVFKTTKKDRDAQQADQYHDYVVVSMFMYFFATLVATPVWLHGGVIEGVAAWGFIGVWGYFVRFDFKTRRMNQRARNEKLGIVLISQDETPRAFEKRRHVICEEIMREDRQRSEEEIADLREALGRNK